MQVYALFAVLSYLSTSLAAPLLIGIPGLAQVDIKLPSLPKAGSPLPSSISLPALAIPPTPTDAASAKSAVDAIIGESKDAIKSLADQFGVAIPSDVVSVSINTDLLKGSATAALPSALPTGIPAVGVAPQDLLKKLGQLVGGFDKPSKAQDAVAQLKQATADLEAASKAAVASLKSGTSYSQYLDQTTALVRNANNYINGLPKKVSDDSSVKQAATQFDQTLAGYLKSLSSASGSSKQFGDEIFKAGVNVKTITSSLLKQTSSAIPSTSLTTLFPGFEMPKFNFA